MCTFICKSAVPTLGTLECLEKLVQNYSCKGQYSGTSVARPLKFCVSYRDIKSYLWSNFHASITFGSRVIEGSHCPKWFCFYRSMFLTVVIDFGKIKKPERARIFQCISVLCSVKLVFL